MFWRALVQLYRTSIHPKSTVILDLPDTFFDIMIFHGSSKKLVCFACRKKCQSFFLWKLSKLQAWHINMKMLKFHPYGINFSARSDHVKTYVVLKHLNNMLQKYMFNTQDFIQVSLNFVVLLCAVSPITWISWWILLDGIFHHMGAVAYRAHVQPYHLWVEYIILCRWQREGDNNEITRH